MSTKKERLDWIIELFGCTMMKWVLALSATKEQKADICRQVRDLFSRYITGENFQDTLNDTEVMILCLGHYGPSAAPLVERLVTFCVLLEQSIAMDEENTESAA